MALLDPEMLALLLVAFVVYKLSKSWSFGNLVSIFVVSSRELRSVSLYDIWHFFHETTQFLLKGLAGTEILECSRARKGLIIIQISG